MDQTGNVIASAAIISDEAVEIAGVVKIILNSGLGILSSFIAVCWYQEEEEDSNKEQMDTTAGESSRRKFSWLFLWDKFPKFALGYLFCCGMLWNLPQIRNGQECILAALKRENTEILYANSSLLMDLGLKSLERSLCDFPTFSGWVLC